MTDIRINNELITPGAGIQNEKTKTGEENVSFNEVMKTTLNEINKLQTDADKAIEKVELQDSGSIHEAMIALEKADISFRTMMQVRNKILEAYQDVMRMQV